MLKLLEALHGTRNAEDPVIWNGGNTKRFSVSSAYSLLSEGAQLSVWPWKCIGKIRAPSKVTCVSWLVGRKACVTHEVFAKKGNSSKFQMFSGGGRN